MVDNVSAHFIDGRQVEWRNSFPQIKRRSIQGLHKPSPKTVFIQRRWWKSGRKGDYRERDRSKDEWDFFVQHSARSQDKPTTTVPRNRFEKIEIQDDQSARQRDGRSL
jgi:hypothetical protein